MSDDAPPPGFEWDPAKAASNRTKHTVTFDEAADALAHPRARSGPDVEHSTTEMRVLTFAPNREGRLLAVVHTRRGANARIISARRAGKRERQDYAQASTTS